MKKIDVNYKPEVFTENGQVKPDGFSCIEFIRNGDENITIANAIELNADRPDFALVNRPGEIIRNNFEFKFAGGGTNPKLVVIMTYYQEK